MILGSCGGSNDDRCDSLGEESIVSTQSIYTIQFDLFEVDTASATWTNKTTENSGTAEITEVDGCVILLGCGTVVTFTFNIPLVAGTNEIDTERTFVRNGEDECQKKTYYITF